MINKFRITKRSLSEQASDSPNRGVNFKMKARSAGAFLAGLILPAIGAIIAWGLWTSLFLYNYDSDIALGWVKNKDISRLMGHLVGPGITYLLPLLIAYNGGRMIYGIRGGVIATFVVFAAIIGGIQLIPWFTKNWNSAGPTSAPAQFIGAMVLGPLSALFLKKIEKLYLTRISSSFEMLVKNFGIGIYGLLLGAATFFGWSPIMWGIALGMSKFVGFFAEHRLTWVLGFFTEPIKVTFLNNALNHGVMGPIGYAQVDEMRRAGAAHPRSIYFLFDPNPGPGLGLLISYMIFAKGANRSNAYGSSIIHFFGGIHEVYFVFILGRPSMLLGTTLGVVGAQAFTLLLGGGTIGTPSPGSIFSLIALSPGTKALWVNLVAVAIGTGISLLICSGIHIFGRKHGSVEELDMKITDEGISFGSNNKQVSKNNVALANFDWANINKIVVACEAGMGSSAMAVGIVKKRIREFRKDIIIEHASFRSIPQDADVIITMSNFKELVKKSNPKSYIYPVKTLIGKTTYDELVRKIKNEK